MTNATPNFPGKPAQTGAKPPPSWAETICPILTGGEIARQGPTMLVQLGAEKKPQLQAQACLGPKCAMYSQLMKADGTVFSQGCAIAQLIPMQLGLNQMVSKFIEAAEAGARAEAAEQAAERVNNAPPAVDPVTVAAPSPLTESADNAEAEADAAAAAPTPPAH